MGRRCGPQNFHINQGRDGNNPVGDGTTKSCESRCRWHDVLSCEWRDIPVVREAVVQLVARGDRGKLRMFGRTKGSLGCWRINSICLRELKRVATTAWLQCHLTQIWKQGGILASSGTRPVTTNPGRDPAKCPSRHNTTAKSLTKCLAWIQIWS